MMEIQLMNETFKVISESAYLTDLVLMLGAGVVLGGILAWGITAGFYSTRMRNEAMKNLTDKEYKIVDSIRRI